MHFIVKRQVCSCKKPFFTMIFVINRKITPFT